jgi:hypothetical protein
MVHVTDIHPLTGFLRNHKSYLERLAATGRPEVLTVNGKARLVVQDAEAYQKLLDVLDSIETEQIVRERLAALNNGEPGVPADQVLADIRKRLGIERR